jgi:hypothetical protein
LRRSRDDLGRCQRLSQVLSGWFLLWCKSRFISNNKCRSKAIRLHCWKFLPRKKHGKMGMRRWHLHRRKLAINLLKLFSRHILSLDTNSCDHSAYSWSRPKNNMPERSQVFSQSIASARTMPRWLLPRRRRTGRLQSLSCKVLLSANRHGHSNRLSRYHEMSSKLNLTDSMLGWPELRCSANINSRWHRRVKFMSCRLLLQDG